MSTMPHSVKLEMAEFLLKDKEKGGKGGNESDGSTGAKRSVE